jgi:hypothetical protein
MPPLGYYSEYDCPGCGSYRVSGTIEELIEKGTVNPKNAHIQERDGIRWLVK